MTAVDLRFSRDEFAARLTKTRAAMAAKGVDLLIVTDPSNMNWLTGYDGWSFYVHQCVIVPPKRRTDLVWPWSGCQWRKADGLSAPRKHPRIP